MMNMSTIDNMHKVQEQLTDDDIIFYYSGYITEDILLSVGKILKKKMEMVKVDRKASRAIFAIFVEEVQNIIRYSKAVLTYEGDDTDESDELRHGFVSIGKKEDRYFVCCGNLILNEDVGRLDEYLTKIKNLDADGLKLIYKETLKKQPPEGSKGAGVGFVDIARRAKGGFEFKFKDVDNLHKFFYLKAYA